MAIHIKCYTIRIFRIAFLLTCSAVLFFSCNNGKPSESVVTPADDNTPPDIQFNVVNVFSHDTTSYTEGLLIHEGHLFESTGHTNSFPSTRSLFGIVNLSNGQIDIKAEIDKNKWFGEGIAFLKGRLYQLTDTTHIGFIYDTVNFRKLGNFYYDGEGWGLTTNGQYLIMSNGSSNLYYRDPATFRIVKTLGVTDNNGPVQNINELEPIHGFIYANQWLTDYILKIDTTSGKVVGRLDMSSLKKEVKLIYSDAQETNGIAFDSVAGKIYVTGKMWPRIFEIHFNY